MLDSQGLVFRAGTPTHRWELPRALAATRVLLYLMFALTLLGGIGVLNSLLELGSHITPTLTLAALYAMVPGVAAVILARRLWTGGKVVWFALIGLQAWLLVGSVVNLYAGSARGVSQLLLPGVLLALASVGASRAWFELPAEQRAVRPRWTRERLRGAIPSIPHMIGWRRSRGQSTVEYAGMVGVVALIIGALLLTGVGPQIANGLQTAVCNILGGDCESDTVAGGGGESGGGESGGDSGGGESNGGGDNGGSDGGGSDGGGDNGGSDGGGSDGGGDNGGSDGGGSDGGGSDGGGDNGGSDGGGSDGGGDNGGSDGGGSDGGGDNGGSDGGGSDGGGDNGGSDNGGSDGGGSDGGGSDGGGDNGGSDGGGDNGGSDGGGSDGGGDNGGSDGGGSSGGGSDGGGDNGGSDGGGSSGGGSDGGGSDGGGSSGGGSDGGGSDGGGSSGGGSDGGGSSGGGSDGGGSSGGGSDGGGSDGGGDSGGGSNGGGSSGGGSDGGSDSGGSSGGVECNPVMAPWGLMQNCTETGTGGSDSGGGSSSGGNNDDDKDKDKDKDDDDKDDDKDKDDDDKDDDKVECNPTGAGSQWGLTGCKPDDDKDKDKDKDDEDDDKEEDDNDDDEKEDCRDTNVAYFGPVTTGAAGDGRYTLASAGTRTPVAYSGSGSGSLLLAAPGVPHPMDFAMGLSGSALAGVDTYQDVEDRVSNALGLSDPPPPPIKDDPKPKPPVKPKPPGLKGCPIPTPMNVLDGIPTYPQPGDGTNRNDWAEKVEEEAQKHKLTKDFTKEDALIIADYTGSWAEDANKYLRGQPIPGSRVNSVPKFIEKMDTALEHLPPVEGTFYRGTFMPDELLERYANGEEVEMPEYLSTSSDPAKADRAAENAKANGRQGENVVMEITTSDGRNIDPLSRYRGRESEVLIPRGGKFVKTGETTKMIGGKEVKVIQVKQVD